MVGLLLRSPQRRATSGGSVILNSQSDLLVHLMQVWLSLSVSSSRRNCHSWIWEPVLNSTCGDEAAPGWERGVEGNKRGVHIQSVGNSGVCVLRGEKA